MRQARANFSDAEVRKIAKQARDFYGLSKKARVDPIACFKRSTVWTIFGEKSLSYSVVSNADMGSAYAKTTHTANEVRVVIAASVEQHARFGEGRARNTYAHELCHATMHIGEDMPRGVGIDRRSKWVKPYEDREHHAKIFAAAFLINDEVAATLQTADEVSAEFGISLESAAIYVDSREIDRTRDEASTRVMALAKAFREKVSRPSEALKFIDRACPACSAHTVFPVGTMFMCQTCDKPIGQFPDGDL